MSRAEFIYFIQQGERGPVKIGYTTNPGGRVLTLQSAHFERLHLIGLTPGARHDEENLHRKLKEFALGREWFKPVPEVFAEIVEPMARVDDALDKAVVAREHLGNAIALLRASDRERAHEELVKVLSFIDEAVSAYQPTLRLAEPSS